MTPLPGRLGDGTVVAWRLDAAIYASEWQSGEGAFRVGGRWNSKGTRAVYCSFDPATAILEVAVHKGFRAFSLVPHVMTSFVIPDSATIKVIQPQDLPVSDWLKPGMPSAEQQAYGDELLNVEGIAALPSAVSPRSWNVLILASNFREFAVVSKQVPFSFDPRLDSSR